MSIPYPHKHNGLSDEQNGYPESRYPYRYNWCSRSTDDWQRNGSTGMLHGNAKMKSASSPISSLSPPQSSVSSEPLSHSSLDCQYDCDSHKGETSSASQYFTVPQRERDSYLGAQAVSYQQVMERRGATHLESPDSLQSCNHDPSAWASRDLTLKNKLQEIETVLMGPDDMEDMDHSEPAVQASLSWKVLLDDLISSKEHEVAPPRREVPNMQKLAISEPPPVHSYEGQVSVSVASSSLDDDLASPDTQHTNHSSLPCNSSSGVHLLDMDSSPTSVVQLTKSPPHPSVFERSSWSPGNRVRNLLVTCATAINEEKLAEAEAAMQELRKEVSVFGDPMERLAAYMSEGLVARLHASGSFLYKALKCTQAPAVEVMSAMQKLYEICPYFKFGYMAANGAIAEACKDEAQIHIFDLQITQGTQWISLIQALASRPNGPPSIRITTVDDPTALFPPVPGVQFVKKRLAKLAGSLNIPFDLSIISAKPSDLQAHMIERRPGEALVVNFTLQLHHMPDESVCETNPRDRLLRLAKSLGPKVVTLVEQESNTNTAPFLARFMETLNYYSAVFESIDVALPRESKDRVNVEEQCLARDIVNVIACEGWERVERHELTGKWRMRMMMAGFRPHSLNFHVNSTIKALLTLLTVRTTGLKRKERHSCLAGWIDLWWQLLHGSSICHMFDIILDTGKVSHSETHVSLCFGLIRVFLLYKRHPLLYHIMLPMWKFF